ncbi:MAG: hypothetical protein VYE68_11480 [Acidobacteriota bacterium]|nr:hypothetical protein [Acidobacteriota bacterium]
MVCKQQLSHWGPAGGGRARRRHIVYPELVVAALIFALSLTATNTQAQPNPGDVAVSTGVAFSRAYLFRGIAHERSGGVLQPYFDLAFHVFEAPEGLEL